MIDALIDFLAVATEGSFAQVAKQQGVAVSSITRKIERLEAELGTRLFNRSSRRVQLTDAGEQFLPHARNMLAELAEARDSLASLNSDPRGLLTVTAPATFGRLFVVPAVVSFVDRFPSIEVNLHVGDQYVDLSEQRVDVAIRIGALTDSDLLATRLAPMRLIACASPAYLARHGRPASPDDLPAHNCIDVATGVAPTATWCFKGWNRDQPYKVRGTCGSMTRTACATLPLRAAASFTSRVGWSARISLPGAWSRCFRISLRPIRKGPNAPFMPCGCAGARMRRKRGSLSTICGAALAMFRIGINQYQSNAFAARRSRGRGRRRPLARQSLDRTRSVAVSIWTYNQDQLPEEA